VFFALFFVYLGTIYIINKITVWNLECYIILSVFLDTLKVELSECVGGAGPKLFTACPMDVAKSNIWFTDLWNYFIVSYLAEAVRQSLQVHTYYFHSTVVVVVVVVVVVTVIVGG